MARRRDLPVLALAVVAAATALALGIGGPGEPLLAVAGLSLPALLLLAGGPARPRWLGWVHAALAVDLAGSGLLLLALRSTEGARIAGLPAGLVVQLVGLWLVPFLLTATAALVAGRRR